MILYTNLGYNKNGINRNIKFSLVWMEKPTYGKSVHQTVLANNFKLLIIIFLKRAYTTLFQLKKEQKKI